MKSKTLLLNIVILFSIFSCVGTDIMEDFIQPAFRGTGIDSGGNIALPSSFIVGNTHKIEIKFFNDIGAVEDVTYESLDTSVLTISATGDISAVGPGTTKIKAIAKNTNPNTSAERPTYTVQSKDIEVKPMPDVAEIFSITNSVALLQSNQTHQLKFTYTNKQGVDDPNVKLTWVSTNASVATVSSAGLITTIADGTTIIRATTPGGVISEFTLKVSSLVSVLRVNNALPAFFRVGNTHTVSVDFFDKDGTINSGATINWKSDEASVASVNSNGVITAVSVGTAKITGSTIENGNTIETVIAVNVVNNVLTINNQVNSLKVGETHQYNTSFAGSTPITWSSSNASFATVSSQGLVTAVAEGSVIITASTVEGGMTLTTNTSFMVTKLPITSKKGSLSGTYSLSGAVVFTSSSIMITNFVSTAPDTHLYLTNNPNSIAGGLKITTSSVRSSSNLSLSLNNVDINSYSYLVAVCQGAGNLILGNAELQ